MRRVVITGLGAVTPLGNDVSTFWSNLLQGKSGANLITRFDTTEFKTKFACEVKDFDPLNYFDRKEARKLDRYAHYGLVAADEAIHHSGVDFDKVDRTKVGVIWSSGVGGFETFELQTEDYVNSGYKPAFNPFFITKLMANGVAGQLSIKYGLKGISACPVTACASSTQGLVDAFNYIRWGKADMIITGGSEAAITRTSIGGFNSMKALSTNNDNFAHASRPYDTTRDGFVMGEGAGALVVESLDHALARGANILAEVVGGGLTSDAYHITATHPEGEGGYTAMKMCVEEAEIDASEINYINAHATSTPVGDISEVNAIHQLMGDAINKVHISASKSMMGHLFGAAGAAEAVATVMTLHTNKIHPTINTINVDEELPAGLNLCLDGVVEKEVNYALSNSFGFGGHCAAILLKRYQ